MEMKGAVVSGPFIFCGYKSSRLKRNAAQPLLRVRES